MKAECDLSKMTARKNPYAPKLKKPVTDMPLIHVATGRTAAVILTDHFGNAGPVSLASGKYVLLIASERLAIHCTSEYARAWIDAGAAYICAWGPASASVEEDFDYAAFLPELGEPLPYTLMTTSHASEPLEEALWFAFHNAQPPDDLPSELNAVLIVVDSPALEEACLQWIKKSNE